MEKQNNYDNVDFEEAAKEELNTLKETISLLEEKLYETEHDICFWQYWTNKISSINNKIKSNRLFYLNK